MRIGLVDVDNTDFPNLALGKIAQHHTNKATRLFGLIHCSEEALTKSI